MFASPNLRGFIGGLILRGPALSDVSCQISLYRSDTEQTGTSEIPDQSSLYFLSKSIKISDGVHMGGMMHWGVAQFSMFAFDIVALLNGSHQSGRLSSFHAIGITTGI